MQGDDAVDTAGERLAFPPPPALAAVVRYFHVEHTGGAMVLPASPMALLTCFVRGAATVETGDGAAAEFSRPMLFGPRDRPTRIVWQPGSTFICALLRPQYLRVLFGIDAATLGNAPVDLSRLGPLPGMEALERALQSSLQPAEWADALGKWLLGALARRKGRRGVFALPSSQLDLPTPDIAARQGLSVRQLERRMLASYGRNIRERRRMERYVQLMMSMRESPPRRGELTRLAIDHGYHDQAHMIRDLVHYTGMSPGVLVRKMTTDHVLRLYRIQTPQQRKRGKL